MSQVITEELIKEFQELCLEFRVPVCLGKWKFEVIDGGKTIHKQEQFSRSYVRNMYNALCAIMGGTQLLDASPNWGDSYINYRDQDGTIRTSTTAGNMNRYSLVNSSANGLVLGTGDTEVHLNDYALASKITHSDTGLHYYAHEDSEEYTNESWDDINRILYSSIPRAFINYSAGSYEIKEAGLVSVSGSTPQPMIVRDVLDSSILLLSLQALIVTYTISSPVFPST